MTYDQAMVEAVAKANRLQRPVQVARDYFGHFHTSLFVMDMQTGQPREPIRGHIVRPGDPLTAAQVAIRDAQA
jgi:hypothetical protein